NNGGDGFVVARLLAEKGIIVTVVLVDGEPKTTDAITNYQLLADRPVQIVDMTKSLDVAVSLLKDKAKAPDIVVDAIYGTGFHGELRPAAATAAEYISKHAEHAYALDIPSGLTGDMAEGDHLNKGSAKVSATITFHARKPVHQVAAAREYCGQIIVADIGIKE
ncbi:MAG: NAD(P)H-hydrate epimerase, partial [Eubacterium sp.]|nr:NAD(P)H-hydrate epimerase [Candidatus Colimonas fimequi]